MVDDRYQLAYDEGPRCIRDQQAAIDALQSRAGVLGSASAFVLAVLGPDARNQDDTLIWIAFTADRSNGVRPYRFDRATLSRGIGVGPYGLEPVVSGNEPRPTRETIEPGKPTRPDPGAPETRGGRILRREAPPEKQPARDLQRP